MYTSQGDIWSGTHSCSSRATCGHHFLEKLVLMLRHCWAVSCPLCYISAIKSRALLYCADLPEHSSENCCDRLISARAPGVSSRSWGRVDHGASQHWCHICEHCGLSLFVAPTPWAQLENSRRSTLQVFQNSQVCFHGSKARRQALC